MSKMGLAFGVMAVVATAGAFYLQVRTNLALQREIAGLREEVRSAITAQKSAGGSGDALKALPSHPMESSSGSERHGSSDSEIAKLREEISALRKSTTALNQFAETMQTVQAAQALAKSSESVATKLTPANELKNNGRATPQASTETVMWAAVGGDVDTLSNALAFTASAKVKADDWFATLPDATRQEYGSPEKVIALMIARDAAGLAGFQVIGEKEVSPDNVGVRFRMSTTEGKMKDDTLLMHRADDGWKMMLPDPVVEKFARQLGGKK